MEIKQKNAQNVRKRTLFKNQEQRMIFFLDFDIFSSLYFIINIFFFFK